MKCFLYTFVAKRSEGDAFKDVWLKKVVCSCKLRLEASLFIMISIVLMLYFLKVCTDIRCNSASLWLNRWRCIVIKIAPCLLDGMGNDIAGCEHVYFMGLWVIRTSSWEEERIEVLSVPFQTVSQLENSCLVEERDLVIKLRMLLSCPHCRNA